MQGQEALKPCSDTHTIRITESNHSRAELFLNWSPYIQRYYVRQSKIIVSIKRNSLVSSLNPHPHLHHLPPLRATNSIISKMKPLDHKTKVYLEEWLASLAHFLACLLVDILFTDMGTPRRHHFFFQYVCLVELHQDLWDGGNKFGVVEANETLNTAEQGLLVLLGRYHLQASGSAMHTDGNKQQRTFWKTGR